MAAVAANAGGKRRRDLRADAFGRILPNVDTDVSHTRLFQLEAGAGSRAFDEIVARVEGILYDPGGTHRTPKPVP